MEDTIAAISTPYGEGGIGIIRISGDAALDVLRKVFVPGRGAKSGGLGAGPEIIEKSGSKAAAGAFDPGDHLLTYGHIVDPSSGRTVDEVLAVYMKAPRTYTGEDVVEINCHGGMMPLTRTLRLVLSQGARPAERGEFTQRAFLNGRLDLSQAEAVMDLISAKAGKGYEAAIEQLSGSLSSQIADVRGKVMDILVDMTVNIDYPDEDIEILTYDKLTDDLSRVIDDVEKLLEGAETGRIIKEGLKVAIVGKPNVGKSSLMNSLLREARAIVTDIPGTTRDTIEESLSIRGIPIVLTDTAGIRETEDRIESIGIERSKDSINKADMVIFVLDASRAMEAEDRDILSHLDAKNILVVLNKTDLEKKISAEDVAAMVGGAEIIETSMKEGSGLSEIEDAIVRKVYAGESVREDSVLVTNVRHKDLLEKALASLRSAREGSSAGEALEIVETDIHDAFDSLGEIIGETAADDVISEVFARFCLGK